MLGGDVDGTLILERIQACEIACDEVIAVSERCAEACLALHGNGDITTCFLADLACVELGTVTIRVLSWTTHANPLAAIAVLEACVEVSTASVVACERMVRLDSSWVTCTGACTRLSNACTDLLVALEA